MIRSYKPRRVSRKKSRHPRKKVSKRPRRVSKKKSRHPRKKVSKRPRRVSKKKLRHPRKKVSKRPRRTRKRVFQQRPFQSRSPFQPRPPFMMFGSSHGPGYAGPTSFQNGYSNYFGAKEPFVNGSEWFYPNPGSSGALIGTAVKTDYQSPNMIYKY